MSVKPLERTCKNCSSAIIISERDIAFYNSIEVPPPRWCPDCRMLRRMAHCNEGFLYPGNCDHCKKRVVSQYAPGHEWPVYCVHCWWSDQWQGQDYGRNPDFSRSFFEQFRELELTLPHACLSIDTASENCDYTHHAGENRNSYFIFHASLAEDCYYGYGVKKAVSCVDVHNCFASELCYECIDVDQCYDVKWGQDCFNCSSSAFIRDCIGCQSCFLCVGLRNKKYCFKNEQLTREDYLKRVASFDLGSQELIRGLQIEYRALQLRHTWRDCQIRSAEASNGNYLINANRSLDCYDCRDVEDCRHCAQLQLGSRTCYDLYQFGRGMELCYEGSMIGANAYNVHFGVLCITQVTNLSYCIDCYTSSDCLLSFGLRNAKFCILNKQYDEQTYRALRARIVEKMMEDGEYGEFFPVGFSQFGYNETTAAQYYPLDKQQVLAKGWKWNEELPGTRGKETLRSLPDNIRQVDDSICNELLACESCGRNYRLIAKEIAYYQRNTIPLPRACFTCRRAARTSLRNPRKLHSRTCTGCKTVITSTYAPEAPETVYCESCYHKAVS